jgi:hypothetical protein
VDRVRLVRRHPRGVIRCGVLAVPPPDRSLTPGPATSATPSADHIKVLDEVGGDDALMIPCVTVIMLVQVLDLQANGQGVQIIPTDADDLQRPAPARRAGLEELDPSWWSGPALERSA